MKNDPGLRPGRGKGSNIVNFLNDVNSISIWVQLGDKFSSIVVILLLIYNSIMRYFGFLIMLLISVTVDAQKLVKQKLTENISVRVPDNFYPMTNEDKKQRYESARLPIALYTDPERLADFGVNRSYSLWQDGDLKLLQEFYEASILELYDKVEFSGKGIINVNDHDFAYFEFESVVYPENDFQRNIAKYTYLMYGLQDGTTYLFNFTCELGAKAKYQPIARKIMASIKLK